MDNTTAGLGVCDVLAIIFTVLKLLKVITWSWLWVLSPIWIPCAIVFICIIIDHCFN